MCDYSALLNTNEQTCKMFLAHQRNSRNHLKTIPQESIVPNLQITRNRYIHYVHAHGHGPAVINVAGLISVLTRLGYDAIVRGRYLEDCRRPLV